MNRLSIGSFRFSKKYSDGDRQRALANYVGKIAIVLLFFAPTILWAAEYEAVKSYLTGDWMMDQSRALIREEVERVSGDYEVVIEAEI